MRRPLRYFFQAAAVLLAALLTAGCLFPVQSRTESALKRLGEQQPSAELTAQDVVRIQLEALKYNDDQNRGIEIVYRFASPGNKRYTGPLPRFITMISAAAYRPLLNHTAVEYGEIEVAGDQAAQRVSIAAEGGMLVVYVFLLSRQKGIECNGCWMTDAVFVESVQKIADTV
jgi:hypothetical protein